MERRDLLELALAAPLIAGAPALTTGGRRSPAPLGLQMFTALPLLQHDFDGALRIIAALGYREMETLGAFDRDPAYVRDALARHGLTSPSQHMMPGKLFGYFSRPPRTDAEKAAMSAHFDEAFDSDHVDEFVGQAIGRAKTMGQKYIVWQLGWRPRYGLKDAERYARAFNRAGALCSAAGMIFAYHNHDHEFEPIDGKAPYEIMVEQTDPATVKLEIDFMWVTKAGTVPAELFRRYPGRYRMCHLKDRSADGEIVSTGEGVENFRSLIDSAKDAGIEHYFFEFDRPADPLIEMRKAARYLAPLLAS